MYVNLQLILVCYIYDMKFFINFLLIFVLLSCDDKFSGVVIENSNYNNYIEAVIIAYENQDLSYLDKYLDNDVRSTYSSNILFGKESALNTWADDYYFFKDIAMNDREIYTILNNDKSFSTILKGNWDAVGKFSGKKVSISCYYKFIWKNNKIVEFKGYFDNYPYYNEIKKSYD